MRHLIATIFQGQNVPFFCVHHATPKCVGNSLHFSSSFVAFRFTFLSCTRFIIWELGATPKCRDVRPASCVVNRVCLLTNITGRKILGSSHNIKKIAAAKYFLSVVRDALLGGKVKGKAKSLLPSIFSCNRALL